MDYLFLPQMEFITPRMRIVILAGEIPATTFIDSLINGIAGRGHQVMVMGTQRGTYNYGKNVKVVAQPQGNINKIWCFIKALLGLRMVELKLLYNESKTITSFINQVVYYAPLIQFKPDRIHLQWASLVSQRELLFDLFPNKVMLSLRGAHINYTPIINKKVAGKYQILFPKIYKFHAVSKAIGQEAMKYGAIENKIKTIYTSVDDQYLENEIPKKSRNNELKMIAVGRFHWVKGYTILIDALKLLKASGSKFHLKLIAGNEIPEEIIFAIHQAHLSQNIEIIGNLPHPKVIEMMSESDVLVLPSVNEGIANVVIEAMAIGTPVISSNCGGMTEVIEHGVNGLLFNNRDAQALANQIEVLLKMDSNQIFEMVQQARSKIISMFKRERMLNEFEQFYND